MIFTVWRLYALNELSPMKLINIISHLKGRLQRKCTALAAMYEELQSRYEQAFQRINGPVIDPEFEFAVIEVRKKSEICRIGLWFHKIYITFGFCWILEVNILIWFIIFKTKRTNIFFKILLHLFRWDKSTCFRKSIKCSSRYCLNYKFFSFRLHWIEWYTKSATGYSTTSACESSTNIWYTNSVSGYSTTSAFESFTNISRFTSSVLGTWNSNNPKRSNKGPPLVI